MLYQRLWMTTGRDSQTVRFYKLCSAYTKQYANPWIREKHFKMLDRPNCWNKCGRKRGWAGRCSYCGENGYCCNQDGRGSCTREMAQVLKEWFLIWNSECTTQDDVSSTFSYVPIPNIYIDCFIPLEGLTIGKLKVYEFYCKIPIALTYSKLDTLSSIESF